MVPGFRVLLFLIAVVATAAPALAACPNNADALGTERVLTVDPATYPRVGRKHFPQTLPLRAKEVVLTFDDGPEEGPTRRVLDALKRECVHASFFVLGRSAAAHPALVRRELQEGHTVAHHSFAHPLLDRMSVEAAEAEINRGFAAVDAALYGKAERNPVTPFFRFPGFASNHALLKRLERRQIAVFGADLWASDWHPMTPASNSRWYLGASIQCAEESCYFTTRRRRLRPCYRPSCAHSKAAAMRWCTWFRLRGRRRRIELILRPVVAARPQTAKISK